MKTRSIGIIGYGFVGKAVNQFNVVCETNLYDLYDDKRNTLEHKRKAYNSNVIFINVPTNLKDGRLDTSIVDDCIKDYAMYNTTSSTIVVKSTIPVGTCADLSEKYSINIVFSDPVW